MPGPTIESDRIQAIDILRGFALVGILLMNIQSFSMISAAYINPTAYGDFTGVNFLVWALCHVFADQKFISIFSMLFGAGIILMSGRAEAAGLNAARLHYRRMGWLIVFGILHAYLLWYGDILFTYGVCGLLVYPFRRKSPRFLVLAAVTAAAIGALLWIALSLHIAALPPADLDVFKEIWQPSAAKVEREVATYRGSWLAQMSLRPMEALQFQAFIFPVEFLWKASSLMLLGMALFKMGVLQAQWSRRAYLTLITVGAIVGIPIVEFGIYKNMVSQWDARYAFLFMQYNYWGSYLVSLAIIGVVMMWIQSIRTPRLKLHMAALGRMAFTNYILQTLICTTIFYGHGFGYFGSVERLQQASIALLIYSMQLLIAPVWLSYFAFGPLEWLWRRLTYGQPQPFRRCAATIAAV